MPRLPLLRRNAVVISCGVHARTRLLIGTVRAIEGIGQSAPRLRSEWRPGTGQSPPMQFPTQFRGRGESGALPGSSIVVRSAARVRTVPLVPKTRVLHVRVEPTDLAVWRVVAAARGRALSEFVRELLASAAAEGVTPGEEGLESCPEQHASPARAKAPPTLEERLAALTELAEGLGRSLR
jgi:hypothetical protein